MTIFIETCFEVLGLVVATTLTVALVTVVGYGLVVMIKSHR